MQDIKEGKTQMEESRQGEATVIENVQVANKHVYIESYGCSMNFSDSEIVASILSKEGYGTTKNVDEADLILLNTCSIRDKAEQTVRNRLVHINRNKKENPDLKVGILGCMAERVKGKLLDEEKLVDLVVGPDAYKDLPNLLREVDGGRKAVNVILSKEETYGDIAPVRLGGNGVTAFISITRGCDNMCSFCVVPFTRGRERSRNFQSILEEARQLADAGYKEITLLGQNVDSYLWYGGGLKKDFSKASEAAQASAVRFGDLLRMVAKEVPKVRIRFSTSNPQDMKDDVLYAISEHENICDYIHLPVQSGSTKVLAEMKRGHTREEYLGLIDRIRKIIPGCAISHDMICGFPGETEEDHQETLSLLDEVKYDFGYMYYYSERPNTFAEKKMEDNVSLEVKKRRLTEVIAKQRSHSLGTHQAKVGKTFEVLVEGVSKKNKDQLYGRTTHNTVVVFPKKDFIAGDFVEVNITDCTGGTLIGEAV